MARPVCWTWHCRPNSPAIGGSTWRSPSQPSVATRPAPRSRADGWRAMRCRTWRWCTGRSPGSRMAPMSAHGWCSTMPATCSLPKATTGWPPPPRRNWTSCRASWCGSGQTGGFRTTTLSWVRPARGRKYGPMAIATCRARRCIRSPARCGPASTARRAGMKSTCRRPAPTTAGRWPPTASTTAASRWKARADAACPGCRIRITSGKSLRR